MLVAQNSRLHKSQNPLPGGLQSRFSSNLIKSDSSNIPNRDMISLPFLFFFPTRMHILRRNVEKGHLPAAVVAVAVGGISYFCTWSKYASAVGTPPQQTSRLWVEALTNWTLEGGEGLSVSKYHKSLQQTWLFHALRYPSRPDQIQSRLNKKNIFSITNTNF